MEGRRKILAPLLVALVALGGFLAGYQTGQPAAAEGAGVEPGIQIIPVLRIYHNNKLVYEKVGDPPTHNLVYLFLWPIIPRFDASGGSVVLNVNAFDGSSYALDPDNPASTYAYKHTLFAVVGTGANPPSVSDYTVQLVAYGEAKLVSMWYDENNTAWHVVVSAAVTVATAANITEVGLTTDTLSPTAAQNPADYPSANALVFRDLLPQPISANAGDVIEIQYEIIIDLP